jgi:hypothetical protein
VTDSPQVVRLDPAPSRVFSWISWDPDAPEVRDEATGRLLQPAGPALTVRYRTTGVEWSAWPVSESEATRIMRPGAEFDFSCGRAYSQLIQPYKSKRMVKSGERQETVKQREAIEKQSGRRWLA